MVAGCGCDLCINVCLTCLGFFPGYFHAFYVEYIYFKRRDEVRAAVYDGRRAPMIYAERVQRGGEVVVTAPAPVYGTTGPPRPAY